MPVAPPQPSFNPGGTLNVNSKNAAQGFGSPANIPAAADSTPVLQVIDGNDKGKQFSLGQHPRITIGRAPSCVLTLNDPGVSGQHASIFLHGAQAYVEDTGSRNGVFVNNQKITRHALGAGDLIVIGSTRMVVTNI
jgi:pSer/pThr/pTyr-binding forkhead associated (FHA) protein